MQLITVSVEINNGQVKATVRNGGDPADGEIRWFDESPWRPAPDGLANLNYRDPHDFALSEQRYEPPTSLSVTARCLVGGNWVESEPLTVPIPQDSVAEITPEPRTLVRVGRGGDYAAIVSAIQYLTGIVSEIMPGAIVPKPGRFDEDTVTLPEYVGFNAESPGTSVLDADLVIPAATTRAMVSGIVIADGCTVTWGEQTPHVTDGEELIDDILRALDDSAISFGGDLAVAGGLTSGGVDVAAPAQYSVHVRELHATYRDIGRGGDRYYAQADDLYRKLLGAYRTSPGWERRYDCWGFDDRGGCRGGQCRDTAGVDGYPDRDRGVRRPVGYEHRACAGGLTYWSMGC